MTYARTLKDLRRLCRRKNCQKFKKLSNVAGAAVSGLCGSLELRGGGHHVAELAPYGQCSLLRHSWLRDVDVENTRRWVPTFGNKHFPRADFFQQKNLVFFSSLTYYRFHYYFFNFFYLFYLLLYSSIKFSVLLDIFCFILHWPLSNQLINFL